MPDSQLEGLVEEQVKAMLDADKTFTAYTITTSLRTANPYLEIEHDRVRNWVETLSAEYDYEVLEIGDFAGQLARIWGKRTDLLAIEGVTVDPLTQGLTITEAGAQLLLAPGVPAV